MIYTEMFVKYFEGRCCNTLETGHFWKPVRQCPWKTPSEQVSLTPKKKAERIWLLVYFCIILQRRKIQASRDLWRITDRMFTLALISICLLETNAIWLKIKQISHYTFKGRMALSLTPGTLVNSSICLFVFLKKNQFLNGLTVHNSLSL